MTLTNTHIDILLSQCMKGNQLAQMEVYNRYYLAMYNTALRIVKQQDEAEDIMQEAFLTAFTKLHTFKGDANFGAWLKRIVINQSISKYRKQEFHEDIDNEAVANKINDDEDDTPEESYTSLKAKEVMVVINTLKPNYQMMLTLHFIEGYDYEEICEIMNMSYANCRTMLSRAKESLRKKFLERTMSY
ncbi:MAG: RNA polymerase sigma factor [Flavobacteriaceae bacterium]